jgi:hypothetical protein
VEPEQQPSSAAASSFPVKFVVVHFCSDVPWDESNNDKMLPLNIPCNLDNESDNNVVATTKSKQALSAFKRPSVYIRCRSDANIEEARTPT